MQVRHGEGVAIHADPESCAGHCREAVREALTGARIGEVLSGESNAVRGADLTTHRISWRSSPLM